jgi:hypothetical protein
MLRPCFLLATGRPHPRGAGAARRASRSYHPAGCSSCPPAAELSAARTYEPPQDAPAPGPVRRQQPRPAFELAGLSDRSREQGGYSRQQEFHQQQARTPPQQPQPDEEEGPIANLCFFITTNWVRRQASSSPGKLWAALACCSDSALLVLSGLLPCYTKQLYRVREDEVAVIERFEKFDRVAGPGPVLLEVCS